MRHFLLFSCFLFSLPNFAQLSDVRTGLTLGVTNYITDTSLLLSKSGTGYSVGATAIISFGEKSDLFIDLILNKHFVKFVGRESELAPPEDLKFNLQNFSFSPLYNYNFYNKDEFKLGFNIGPSLTFLYEYDPVDDSSADYLLDPLLATPYDLLFDTRNEQISFNTFLAIGVSAQYKAFVGNFRYYYGLSDPYRNAPVVAIIDITGKDSYFAFTLSYFFSDF